MPFAPSAYLKETSLATVFGGLKASVVAENTNLFSLASITTSITVDAGDLIFVLVAQQTNRETTGISDNLSNTYAAQEPGVDTGAATAATFWAVASANGTITSFTVTGPTNLGNDGIVIVTVFQGPFFGIDPNLVGTRTNDIASPFTGNSTGTRTYGTELIVSWVVHEGPAAVQGSTTNKIAQSSLSMSVYAAVAAILKVEDTATFSSVFTSTSNPNEVIHGVASFARGFGATLSETAVTATESVTVQQIYNHAETVATSETMPGIKFHNTRILGGFGSFVNSDAINWAGFTLRMRFEPAMLATNYGGDERVTFEFLAGTSGTVAAAYIGHAAASGDTYDFDGNQVQLTFFNGNTSWSVSGASSLTSDYAAGFAYDPTKALIISVAFTGTTINIAGL